jgi:hypothetical protein
MKRKLLLSLFFMAGVVGAFAQKNVGIGTIAPEESAVLDLTSTNKGFLMPRMTSEEKNYIKNPAKGLMVYQTNEASGYYFYNGTQWKPLSENDQKSIAIDPNDWSFGGNTPPTGSYVGTNGSSAEPLILKASGVRTGFFNSSGATFLGANAGVLTTGGSNTAVGGSALSSNTTGTNNTAIGANALRVSTAADNTSIGSASLYSNTLGSGNVAIGTASLFTNVDGNYNTAIGGQAARLNQSGSNNFALGYAALYSNVTGSGNTALGPNALRSNASGSGNTALGGDAGYAATGSNNVFLGSSAGYNSTGNNQLYIANTNTATPLIYGDFAAKYVTIGDVPASAAKRGDAAAAGYNLLVKGGILTEKVKVALVTTTDWADYVFEKEYKEKMLSLEEVEKFTLANKHLPNVPSAQQMVDNGMEVGQTSKMFMEKIEELTLYIIELNKEVQKLKAENLNNKK